MLSIVYSSSAAHPFSDAELDALLAQSRANNERLGLTGMLLHRDGRFIQVLEGPDDALRERMATIAADQRHGRVTTLLEEEIGERQFPDWTMGFARADDAADTEVPGFRRTFADLAEDRESSDTIRALRQLIGWYRDRPAA